jgi:hypothetical protein
VKSVIQLPHHYDVSRLRADLEAALASGQQHENRGDYHDGGWTAVALVAVGGATDARGLRWGGWDAPYQKTPVLAQCPYFEEIIDSFRCPTQRVRLLQLAPGKNIHEHRDDGDGWAIGKIRVHIPIVTHEDVYFYVDGQRVIMNPGELWYCDFTRPHRVHNRSPIGRVHMVLDLVVDDWLRAMFPPEPLVEQIRNWEQRARYRGRVAAYRLARSPAVKRARQRLKRVVGWARR